MDNPTTLLVAIMYVTIIATGLINLLMMLSDIVGGRCKTDPLHTGWIALLLLAYFDFFWETTAILNIEGWNFLSFLCFIIGPIALLFATNLIASSADPDEGTTPAQSYFEQSARFFLLLCLTHVWIVGLDVVFEGVSYVTYLTAFVGFLFVFLMFSKRYRTHVMGLVIVGLAFISRMGLMAL